jgi:hypothetical protein
MEIFLNIGALAPACGCVVFRASRGTVTPGHDIPHPIGDPDEDDELPGDDDDEEDDDEDDEEPMQLRVGRSGVGFAPQHKFQFSGIIRPLR